MSIQSLFCLKVVPEVIDPVVGSFQFGCIHREIRLWKDLSRLPLFIRSLILNQFVITPTALPPGADVALDNSELYIVSSYILLFVLWDKDHNLSGLD